MQSSNDPARLKAQMLRAAVQDNADTIADRLPPAIRPGRRFLAIWARRAWLLPVPFSIIVALTVVGNRSMAAVRSGPLTPAILEMATPEPFFEATPPSAPDPSLFTRPLHPQALALGVRRVVLDPGHGGAHHGATSPGGLLEKHVTLDLAQRAKRLLVERGFEVVLTRTGDEALSLKERAATANERRGDIFVSIHLNAFEPASALGVETFYLGPSEHPEHEAVAAAENEHSGYSLADMRTLLDGIYVDARRDESARLARAVQHAMVHRLRTTDPSMPDRGVKTAPFVVLVATEMPAILAEVSCLSHAGEAERLGTEEYRQTIAEALVAGIQGFVHQHSREPGRRKDIHGR